MALPFEILFGIYLGILTGIVPALIAGGLGFVFRYVTGVTVPAFGVVVLSLGVAGINGGLLALNDETIRSSERAPALLTAIVVVLMLAFYAHNQGDKLGATVPRRVSLKSLRERTLSTDVIELVGNRRRVRVTVAGGVGDVEGYPPLPADTRERIADGEWTFPADLPLAELEERFAERLRTEFDLAEVSVSVDRKARATVSAAPPAGGLSKRVSDGQRAVSLSALVPTGLVRGETVRLITPETTVEGTLVSASAGSGGAVPSFRADGSRSEAGPLETDGGSPSGLRTGGGSVPSDESDGSSAPGTPGAAARTTAGGEGRVTVAVDRSEAGTLLRADRGRIVVLSGGSSREFELTSLLRRTGKRFQRVTVAADGPLDGTTLREAEVRDAFDVVVVAANHDGWTVVPRGSQRTSAGDELIVVGTRDALDRFAEAAT